MKKAMTVNQILYVEMLLEREARRMHHLEPLPCAASDACNLNRDEHM